MAELVVDGYDLVLRLRLREKIVGFHGNIRVPLTSVRSVRVPENSWLSLRGWRMAGFAFPGVVALGTRRHGDGYDFTAVRRDRRVVQIDLAPTGRFSRLVVSVPEGGDADAEADRIAQWAGIARST